MKFNQELIKGLFLFATPLVTSSVFATSPGFAATFAVSESKVNIGNFSHNPLGISTLTDTDTTAISLEDDGQVQADANAKAIFTTEPPTRAYNTSLSTAKGTGNSYLGGATSLAAVIGYDFIVGSGEAFSFDFNAFLKLETSIDNPKTERANTDGQISFELYDSSDPNQANWFLLDLFTLSGGLATKKGGDYLYSGNNNYITYNPNETYFNTTFGGTQESAEASATGRYSRTFDSLIKLTLVEAKTNRVSVKASVQTPESSSLLGLLLFSLLCIGYGIKSKACELR
ncbi:MAG TPA: hypothetical protein V6C95_11690 [Coleofasciculaceae cyanobacterium]